MKKTYVIPFITLENIEEESLLQQFSKQVVDIIGEGDTKPEGPGNDGDNSEGEGLNAKGNGTFIWDDEF